MPLIVKDFIWRQTDANIIVQVPLKDVHFSKVDIFTSNKYIKANYHPFFFEVILLYPINETESKCTITDKEIIFDLKKLEQKNWETLNDTTITKKAVVELKQKIIEETQKQQQTAHDERQKLKSELTRVAVRKQMMLDDQRLKEIEKLKNTARNQAMSELEQWKKHKNTINFKDFDSDTKNTSSVIIKEINDKPDDEQTTRINYNKQLEDNSSDVMEENVDDYEQLPTPVPLPRNFRTIEISFSERIFPTPSRESRSEDEQTWLKKQAEIRRIHGWVPEDLTPEERDPDYLKMKGDTFFKHKNYIGAISAYGCAIKMCPNYAALYVNRSAAHFAYGNLHKCIEDCSKALELLTPPVAANLESRAKCFARRGAALCKLGVPSRGIGEFEAALKLMPNDENLKLDLEQAKEAVQFEKDGEPELFINKQPLTFIKK